MVKSNFVCIASTRWDFLWQRPQQLMSRISKTHNVLFVDHSYPVGVHEAELLFRTPEKWKDRLRHIFDNLHVLSTVHLGKYTEGKIFDLKKFNFELSEKALSWTLKELNITKPILITYLPESYRLLPVIQPQLTCYDCVDSFADFSWAEDSVRQDELDLLKLTDITFASAKNLVKKLRSHHNKVILLPNGVDYNHFSAVQSITKCASQGNQVILGFVGALYDWVDTELLFYILKQRPNWRIVAVGPSHGIDIGSLKKHDNFLWLGSKDYRDLPKYMSTFDVCIIPFLRNPVTDNANPIKMWEYMATGLPIVSTDIPEVSQFSSFIHVAHSHEHFIQEVEKAIKKAPPKRQLYVARTNDWSRRVTTLLRVITWHRWWNR